MRDYELVVLYHPDLEIDLDKALKKVEGVIKNSGGKVLFSDNWGKRRLAYTIKKQDYAIYVYYEIQLDAAAIGKLEGLLNITDEVVRYLVSKPTPNFGDRDKPTNVDEIEEASEADIKEDKPSSASSDAKAVDDKKATEGKEEKSSSASDDAKAKTDKKATDDKKKTTKTKDAKDDEELKEE